MPRFKYPLTFLAHCPSLLLTLRNESCPVREDMLRKNLLTESFGERIRRGGGPTRIGALINRWVTSETKQIDRGRQQKALQETVDYIDTNLPTCKSYPSPYDVLKYAVEQANHTSGLFLEFGVRDGFTINWAAKWTTQTIYGFDSFEGLPEDWTTQCRRGAFKVERLPRVRDNVTLVKGLFHDSLPPFLRDHPDPVAFVHIDSDLYSSAVTIFELLAPRFRAGSVIAFDEFFNYPGWREGEFKAFTEFQHRHGVDFEYLGYCHFGEQLALRINSLKG